jgi:large subunit ribosomal protein L2
MGKRIITQRRGRGTSTYKAHSHRWKFSVKHRQYDTAEQTGVIHGKVVDLVHATGFNAPIAKVSFENGETQLMFAPMGIGVNDPVSSGSKAEPKLGNTLPLKSIPEGTEIFNIESHPADGGSFVRCSGASAKVLGVMKGKIRVVFPSKKIKMFDPSCRATIGAVAGSGKKDKPLMKAGNAHLRMRAKGKLYPRTSGVAMNAVDHPFGSGRGRHVGKHKTAPRFAPPGRNVGLIKARRTGKKN